MQNIEIWHNQSCSKSNSAKDYLDSNKIAVKVRDYLDNPPSKEELKELLTKLNLKIKDIIRDSEKLYYDLDIQKIQDDENLLEIVSKNPILIQRPIIIGETKAFIARPPLKIEEILNEF
ncbi:Arsenate reductase [Aliarcobacter thereius]|uniref:Arsenate reductase n=2 Tax=Aliarcobacter thereius TaxID=544718 RepID=A0A1C0B3U5_9BACT|nr:ArsC/Spx/MgsR family protein [Aliarcobacter thereius]OCL86027.1 Arsenate reductase [Aliarcobacter thereius]OCL90509.1 Arsenate reductase [Aliarcobacter thereius]OCL95696.1 Arsenate reductase [Aliarcobacter thereius LMG 24486]OCL96952.1 Arsenate reductase [Aliarcobacter thereius]QBF16320.1 arsenate reductase (ArsC) family protein [Aliarcobacter thereius LMG 24486]